MNFFSKYFLLLTIFSAGIMNGAEKNRFQRIVARYPHLSVFLASAAGATAGVYIYKKFDKSAAKKDIKSLFDSEASPASITSLGRAAVAGAIMGTAIAAVADCGMPRFAPKSNSSVILAG